MGTSLRTLFGRFLPNRTTVARAMVLIAVGMVVLLPNPVILQAALFTWTGPGGNQFDPASGNWNVAANWIGGLPPTNNAETDLSFAGSSATPYISTHNLGLMLVNDLSLSSSATVTETIAASGGSSLRFVNDGFGTDPTITQNGTGAFAINVPIDVALALDGCLWLWRHRRCHVGRQPYRVRQSNHELAIAETFTNPERRQLGL